MSPLETYPSSVCSVYSVVYLWNSKPKTPRFASAIVFDMRQHYRGGVGPRCATRSAFEGRLIRGGTGSSNAENSRFATASRAVHDRSRTFTLFGGGGGRGYHAGERSAERVALFVWSAPSVVQFHPLRSLCLPGFAKRTSRLGKQNCGGPYRDLASRRERPAPGIPIRGGVGERNRFVSTVVQTSEADCVVLSLFCWESTSNAVCFPKQNTRQTHEKNTRKHTAKSRKHTKTHAKFFLPQFAHRFPSLPLRFRSDP